MKAEVKKDDERAKKDVKKDDNDMKLPGSEEKAKTSEQNQP